MWTSWRERTFKTETIGSEKQEPSALHPKNLKCFGVKRHSLAVDLVPIQKLGMVSPGGQNLLSKYVISETGFCEHYPSERLSDAPAGWSTPNTDFANDILKLQSSRLKSMEHPGRMTPGCDIPQSKTYKAYSILFAKILQHARPCWREGDLSAQDSE